MRHSFLVGASRLAAGATLLSAAAAAAQTADQAQAGGNDGHIVVTASRAMIEALRGINPEREYDQADVAAYGVSTVGDVIDEVRAENGDEDEPVFLVDGEPVADVGDVADFPAEAVDRLEVLPRGSGQKIGRESDRRVYNVVLKKQMRSLTLTAGRREATEGEWGESSGEAILTRIAGQQRLNLTLRARDSGALSEDDRGIVQPDPATVTPAAAYYEPIEAGRFRTLRGPSSSYEASLIGGGPLARGITSSFSLVGRSGRDRSLSGLPYGLFLLPGTSPFSPSGSDERLVLFGPNPLANRSHRESLNGNATINATRGSWTAGLTGQFALNHQRYGNERLDNALLVQPVTVPAGRNPFADPLADFFPLRLDTATTDQRSWLVRLNLGGAVVKLPAGEVRLRGSVERGGDRSHGVSLQGNGRMDRSYARAATRFDGGIDIPLASRDFLAPLGQLTLSLDRGHAALGRLPNLDRSSVTALWQPSQRVSLTAFAGREEQLPPIELLADPVVIYQNVRTFDFLTGETVDVTVVTGGNPALRAPAKRTRRLSFSVAPWPRYNLQLSAEYEAARVRDSVSAVPAASTPVFLAFPERFQRDAAGRLVTVDTRPVNFQRESTEQLRYGASFFVPLGFGARPAPAASQARLEVSFSHTVALRDTILIRQGLPLVDLLEGGAVGIGGGRARHIVSGSIAATKAGSGVRLTALYRSGSTLLSGTPAAPETLRFAPIFTASLRAFAELGPLLPKAEWLKDTRLSLTVENLADKRQRVRDEAGLTPLRYQPGYLDPIGRTVGLELRKVF
jgi:hypothetical protein